MKRVTHGSMTAELGKLWVGIKARDSLNMCMIVWKRCRGAFISKSPVGLGSGGQKKSRAAKKMTLSLPAAKMRN